KPRPFHVEGAEKEVPVPTMYHVGRYKGGGAGGGSLRGVPYGNGDIAMVIVLPDARAGVAKGAAELPARTRATWPGHLAPCQKVKLSLPSFEFAFGGSVKEVLRSLGMQRAFTDDAELDRIAKGAKLKVSDVFHKTYVKVDESGTEAAAATGA